MDLNKTSSGQSPESSVEDSTNAKAVLTAVPLPRKPHAVLEFVPILLLGVLGPVTGCGILTLFTLTAFFFETSWFRFQLLQFFDALHARLPLLCQRAAQEYTHKGVR